MRIRKEAELNTAILHFLAKCVAEGDDQTLAYLGLDRTDAEAIQSLHLTDIDHLSSVHFPLLRKASIDRDLMHRLIERVRDLRQSTSVRDALLTLDAPFPLLQALFGTPNADGDFRSGDTAAVPPIPAKTRKRRCGKPMKPCRNQKTTRSALKTTSPSVRRPGCRRARSGVPCSGC